MYENKLWIFDDIVSVEDQEHIKNEFFGNNFPWFFISDITNSGHSNQKRPAFQHTLIKDSTNNSEYCEWLLPIVKNSEDKIGFKSEKIEQGRAFLQLPLNIEKKDCDDPHVDLNYKHLVVLYYVITSDGETIIYNEQNKTNNDKYTIKKSVKPKQGRVVIFDGRYYHTANQPNKDIRCVINYNLI